MILTPLDADVIYARWDWIRAGLLQVIKRTEARFRPEDVYCQLRAGKAWVYEIGDAEGFAILTQEWDMDGMALYIWALWTEVGAMRLRDAVLADLDQLARNIKAKRIRLQSPRKGWGRFFTEVCRVYEREVK